MQFSPEDLSIFLSVAIVVISYKGLTDAQFMDAYCFDTGAVRQRREYWRILSSAFLHVNLLHLIFNVYALYAFASVISRSGALDTWQFALLYLFSLIAGDLLTLWSRRFDDHYKSVGASGAISGVVFAFIVMAPEAKLSLILLPVTAPAWLFGGLYLLYTMYGVRQRSGSTNHEAHLGGAVAGMLAAFAFRPDAVMAHAWIFLAYLLPVSLFLAWVMLRPDALLLPAFWKKNYEEAAILPLEKVKQESRPGNLSQAREAAPSREEELDHLLDRVRAVGLQNLSRQERKRLDELSQEIHD